MQKAYYLAIMVLTIASCSGIPKEKEVTVSNVSISGTLRDFVKVVDGTYTLSNNGEDAFATIEFELINEPYGEVAPILSKTNSSQVILQIIDSKGNYIELEKLDDLIYKSKIGDKRRISFTMHYFNSNENSELVFTNATNFEVIDRAFSYSSDEDVVSIKTSDSKSVTTKGENWDEMLNSYEKYVEQYLKYVKKVNDGDISAMTEYAELLDKTTDLSEKMEKAKGQLSPEQLKRYLNITNKFTTGIIDVTQ